MPCPKEASFFSVTALFQHWWICRDAHTDSDIVNTVEHRFYRLHFTRIGLSRFPVARSKRRKNLAGRKQSYNDAWTGTDSLWSSMKRKKKGEKKREERRDGVVFERHTIFDSNVESKTFAIQKNGGKERKERERENDLNQRVWRYREEKERSNHRKLPFRDDRVEYVIQKVPIVCSSCHKIPGERPVTV